MRRGITEPAGVDMIPQPGTDGVCYDWVVKRYRAGLVPATETEIFTQGSDGAEPLPNLFGTQSESISIESRAAGVRLFVIRDGQEYTIMDKNKIGFE